MSAQAFTTNGQVMTIYRPQPHKEPEKQDADEHLLSQKVVIRILVLFGLLAILTVGISFAGRWIGQTISMGGHTDSTAIHDVFIDRDHLRIPANLIRFASQRRTGTADQVNLQFTWPEMEGFTENNSLRFNDQAQSETLIFVELARRIMTLDMTDRVNPIYRALLEDTSSPGVAGLTIHPFKADGPYKGEVMVIKDRENQRPFAMRCILPPSGTQTSSADCLRDIYIGQDLSVMVRYSSKLLPEWEAIDSAVEKKVKSLLAD